MPAARPHAWLRATPLAPDDTKGRAHGFASITEPTRTQIEIYMKDRCKPEIPGTIPTRAGDATTLSFLDATGHEWLRTPPITVTKQ